MKNGNIWRCSKKVAVLMLLSVPEYKVQPAADLQHHNLDFVAISFHY